MKATISQINESYRIVFIPEDANDELLLDLLTDGKSPFSNQEDGTIAIIKAQEIVRPAAQPAARPTRRKRVFSLATRRKLAAAQKARWAKIKAARQPKIVTRKAA